MANDPVLIERVRDLAPFDAAEKNVFGARCWVLDGHMAFGVHGDDMILRLGPDAAPGLPHFDPMGSGKGMKGWFVVPGERLPEDEDISTWIAAAVAFTAGLPPK